MIPAIGQSEFVDYAMLLHKTTFYGAATNPSAFLAQWPVRNNIILYYVDAGLKPISH